MATATDEIYVKIIAETRDAITNIGNLAKEFVGAYLSVQTLKTVLVDSIKEFLAAEEAETRLSTALKITGQYSKESKESIMGLSLAMQTHTTYTHEATESAAALLLQIGHLTTEGVKQAIPVLMDYASAMGIDLNQAATQLGQAIEGGRNIFQRFGISLKDAHDPTQRFSTIIDGLKNNFQGMAAAIGNTTGGQLKEFQNQIKEMQETVGGFFAEIFGPGLKFINQNLSFRRLMGLDISTMDRATLQSWQDFLVDYSKTLRDDPHWGQQKQLADAGKEMMAVNTAISKLPLTIKGAMVKAVLGDDPDAGLKYLYAAYSAVNAMLGTGMTNANIRGDVTGGPALAGPGTGMEAITQHIPTFGTGGTGSENPSAYKAPIEWTRQLEAEARQLAQTWMDAGKEVEYFGSAIGQALATGNWEGALRSIGKHLADLLAQYAITAAAAAAVAMNWPMAVFWLGVAGVAAAGGSFIGSGGNASTQSNIPHYAGGSDWVPQTGLAVVHQGEQIIPAGGRGAGVVVNVYGGMWQADDLARKVAAAMNRW